MTKRSSSGIGTGGRPADVELGAGVTVLVAWVVTLAVSILPDVLWQSVAKSLPA